MKSEDFKELQEFCELKGYQLLNESLEDNTKFFVVSKKKDEWEGVEFVTTLGSIYRIENVPKNKLFLYKPSTEQAYVDQLKAKAFELYGEIKDGDRFDCSEMGYSKNASILISKCLGLYYSKKFDSLELCGFTLYKQGNWAKKIEKLRVEWKDTSRNYISFSYYNSNTNLVHRGSELAELLEKYLNSDQK